MRLGPAITPEHAKLLVSYLDSVDDIVTIRLVKGHPPDEEHLTWLLCEALDEDSVSLFHLPVPLARLREDFAKASPPLRVSLTVETKKYDRITESKLTSSDLGLVVSYRDNIEPSRSFRRGVLLQAKRLRPTSQAELYTLDNRFEAFETRQLLKLIELQNRFRDADSKAELNCHAIRACQYLFYCPRPEGYSPESREQLDYYLMQKAAPDLDILHDYGYELYRLYEHALYSGIPVYPIGFSPGTWESGREETSHVPGLLVSDLSWLTKNYLEWDNQQQGWIPKKGCKPPSAKEVLAHIWSQVVPLSHFVVMSMLLGRCGTCSPGGLAFIRGESGAQNDDFPILPRHVLTYTFEVGTARG